MSYELRVGRMKPHELEGAPPDFLGDPPDLGDAEMTILALFWRLRHATPSDHPVDLDAALRLHDRLLGPPAHDMAFLDDLQAMDGAYAKARAETQESEIGKPRGNTGERKAAPPPRPLVRH